MFSSFQTNSILINFAFKHIYVSKTNNLNQKKVNIMFDLTGTSMMCGFMQHPVASSWKIDVHVVFLSGQKREQFRADVFEREGFGSLLRFLASMHQPNNLNNETPLMPFLRT